MVALFAILPAPVNAQANEKFIAHAQTLNPQPIKIVPSAAVVKVEVVARPTVQPQESGQRLPAGLTGSIGYASPFGNCVDEPGVNRANGNPITWSVLSAQPRIGATALWTYNHTGVVTGIWSNGDIEVRHRNYKGGQHRFPRSAFRGFR